MIELIKLALRITNDKFDDEISSLYKACVLDLGLAGVRNIDESDPLIIRAAILYCKTGFGYGDDQEKYQKAYEFHKTSLALAGDYR